MQAIGMGEIVEDLNINNYIFEHPLTNDNSGFSKWGIGHRGVKEYFVKEFLSPTYPADTKTFDEEQMKRKLVECSEFEKEKEKLYTAINQSSDGHLVRIHQFFRVDAKYYMVTNAVLEKKLSVEEIAALPYQDRLMVCCEVAHAIALLHKKKVVHADIKPDNILVTKEPFVRAYIIDFDCSFFEENKPALDEELNGDFVYLSPEAFLHMAEIESNLSCQMDVFALGLVFHQYLTGKLPEFDTTVYTYSYEAVLDGCVIKPDKEVGSEKIRGILFGMLQKNPKKRPNMWTIFECLKKELCVLNGRVDEEKKEELHEKPASGRNETVEINEAPDKKKRDFFSMAGDL